VKLLLHHTEETHRGQSKVCFFNCCCCILCLAHHEIILLHYAKLVGHCSSSCYQMKELCLAFVHNSKSDRVFFFYIALNIKQWHILLLYFPVLCNWLFRTIVHKITVILCFWDNFIIYIFHHTCETDTSKLIFTLHTGVFFHGWLQSSRYPTYIRIISKINP